MNNKAVTIQHDSRKRDPWLVRWYGEYDPVAGKQRRYSKAFKRKADAEKFRAKKATALEAGQKRDKPEQLPIAQFCQDWFIIKKKQVRPETQKIYENTIDRLVTYFGPDMLIRQITSKLAARFIAEQRPIDDPSRKSKKKRLSDWSRNKTLRNCKTMFEDAVEWEIIEKNPFRKVKTPKLIVPVWHYLKPAEYQKLLEVTPSLRWKATYALAYTAGFRFGELFSLTWKDIDFETGEVIIENRPATAKLPPFFVKDFESRHIPLPKHTLDILTDLQAKAPEGIPYVLINEQRYQTVLAKWKCIRNSRDRHWCNKDMVNNIPREFKKHLRRAEIEPTGQLSIHTLRKCCGQNWANHLPMHVTKELMGHSSIATTQKYYTQVDESQRAKAAAVGDLLVGVGASVAEPAA